MADQDTEYIYISKLEPSNDILSSDLFVISKLSAGQENSPNSKKLYESKNISYNTILNNIYDYISVTMSSDMDLSLLSLVDELSTRVENMISTINICLSACVALDNCRNNVITKYHDISVKLDGIDARLKKIEN